MSSALKMSLAMLIMLGTSVPWAWAACPDDVELDLCDDGDEVELNGAGKLRAIGANSLILMVSASLGANGATNSALAMLLLPFANVLPRAMAAGTTCGDMKTLYKNEGCCGNPEKEIPAMSDCLSTVTTDMVIAAQQAWGDGIVRIANAKKNGGDYEQIAQDHIDTLYAYGQDAPVLFKPTLAAEKQFRSTLEGALSYFVATNMHAPEDSGFAIKGWTAVRFENEGISLSGNTAMAMGNYYFTDESGTESKVEYSFGYVLDEEGQLRITLHHSSMPYVATVVDCTGNVTRQMVLDAQKEWGDGIVHIASTKVSGGDYETAAHEHIMNLYAYGSPPVLFKPTLAAEMQFRGSFEGALSYFVANNNHSAEDTGFAIKGWTAVRFENEGIITTGNTAMAMGNYFFTNPDGDEVKVEYAFGYVLDSEGKLRINLHHSSLPYTPAPN